MIPISIEAIDKSNWEEALSISLHVSQVKWVPTVMESLAYAYIKPWDEAFDPFILRQGEKAVGFFYLSYTPDSRDNYWIGGFQIDQASQGKGLGKEALYTILEFVQQTHPQCQVVSLTIEKSNVHARKLYEKTGFIHQEMDNQEGEMIYRLKLYEGTRNTR